MSNQPYGAPLEGKTKVLGLSYSIAGLLCYLPVCCINLISSILWMATEPKENKVLRFHALQSLLLIGIWIVLWVIFMFLGVGMAFAPSDTASAAGGGLISLIWFAVIAIYILLCIIGMVKAYQGQIWKIPIIGDIADKNT